MNPSNAWALLCARSKGVLMLPPGYGQLGSDEVAAMLRGLERGPFLMGMVHYAGDVHSLPALERALTIEVARIHAGLGWEAPKRGDCISRRLAATVLFEILMSGACHECGGKGQSPVTYRGKRPRCMELAVLLPSDDGRGRDRWRFERHYVHWRELKTEVTEWELSGARIRYVRRRWWGPSQGEFVGHRACPACQGSGKSSISGRKRAALAGIDRQTWSERWAARYEALHAFALGWRDESWAYLAKQLDANFRAA